MIDKTAIIEPGAKLANDVTVGAYSIIGKNVVIDAGTKIGPHVVISGHTKIGKNNNIFQFASIGAPPQDIKYQDEPTRLEIGDNNTIREFCSLHRGTVNGRGVTKVGDRNFLMAYVHVAHDCILGSDIIFANNATLGGHVVVNDHVLFGGFAAVEQFCTIGAYSFVAATTGINLDVLPYLLVSSYHRARTKPYGLNVIGLRRKGFSSITIKGLKRAYHIIFQEDLSVKDALVKLRDLVNDCPPVQLFIDALEASKHGFIRSDSRAVKSAKI